MMSESRKWLRRCTSVAALSFLVLGATACDDDDPPEEPEIEQIRLNVGTVVINSVSEQPPTQAVSIPRGTHTVTLTAMTASGQTINLSSEFELRIDSSNTNVLTHTRSGLGGTINALAVGTSNLTVEVFHIGEGHSDYTVVFSVTVT